MLKPGSDVRKLPEAGDSAGRFAFPTFLRGAFRAFFRDVDSDRFPFLPYCFFQTVGFESCPSHRDDSGELARALFQ